MDHFTSDLDPFHVVQKHVIITFRDKDKASYSELQPEGMSGNAFNYHFKQLISSKLIAHNKDGSYSLTKLGRLTEDSISSQSFRFKLRPVLGMWICVRSKEHGYLLYKSNRQPLRDRVGLPFGKIVLGSEIIQSADYQFKKRQLDPAKLKLTKQASANIRYFEGEDLISHRSGMVWFYDYSGEPIVTKTISGESLWTHNINDKSFLQEISQIINSNLSFIEINQDIKP